MTGSRERNRCIAAIQGNGNSHAEVIGENDGVMTQHIVSVCGEALFHLWQCSSGRIDGDNDGVSCESIGR